LNGLFEDQLFISECRAKETDEISHTMSFGGGCACEKEVARLWKGVNCREIKDDADAFNQRTCVKDITKVNCHKDDVMCWTDGVGVCLFCFSMVQLSSLFDVTGKCRKHKVGKKYTMNVEASPLIQNPLYLKLLHAGTR